eukprot:TRINITY_DN1897_c0_g2_i1.p1 TRINITY_DN1897_c0_g2~~TRINITY_DN1897_c0_g2_i1.p1  ORF type:complete len:235 (-),score=30.99 TRINITY_DN1897_c0_g2_i1:12-716(-)
MNTWMSKERVFECEYQKILAINRINMEIWNRLSRFKSKSSGYSSIFRFSYPVLKKVFFERLCLCFVYHDVTIKMDSLKRYFKNCENVFRDTLPKYSYFDMEDIIRQYKRLNHSTELDVLLAWKSALEDIHVFLGKIESHIEREQSLSVEIERIFLEENENVTDLRGHIVEYTSVNETLDMSDLSFCCGSKEECKPILMAYAELFRKVLKRKVLKRKVIKSTRLFEVYFSSVSKQ